MQQRHQEGEHRKIGERRCASRQKRTRQLEDFFARRETHHGSVVQTRGQAHIFPNAPFIVNLAAKGVSRAHFFGA
jgi:hypothetical protein